MNTLATESCSAPLFCGGDFACRYAASGGNSVNTVYPIAPSSKNEAGNDATDKIVHTVDDFCLSWSHYLVLMRITDPSERLFYALWERFNNPDFNCLEFEAIDPAGPFTATNRFSLTHINFNTFHLQKG